MRALTMLLLASAALLPCPAYAQGYDSVSIVAPEPETTIHDNNGVVEIQVATSPQLNTRNGDYFTILLDDQVVTSGIRHHFELTGIDRGAHKLVAQVNASDGKVLAESAPVTFYMWHASILFPNRKQPH